MDQQQIKTFIDAMAASDLAEMEFAQDGWTLRLVRRRSDAASVPAVGVPRAASAPAPGASASPPPLVAVVVAPLYGVVHLSPGAGEPAFVVRGQKVSAGQTLCIIEAMKVFNEVRADHDVTIADILVESGQEVDADQPLMRFA
jgi:acetyl-CoA carboxylase biotin carboxyl carrier protein